jgi:hypothetical protein
MQNHNKRDEIWHFGSYICVVKPIDFLTSALPVAKITTQSKTRARARWPTKIASIVSQ